MKRQLAVVFTLISACVPVGEDTAQQRQPLPGVDTELIDVRVVKGGTPHARLGARLDGCRGVFQGGYLAGAPGLNGVYASAIDDFVTVTATPLANIGTSVMCDRSQSLALVGGNPGLFRFVSDGGYEILLDAPVLALAGAVNAAPLVTVQNSDAGTDLYRLRFAGGVFLAEHLASGTSKSFGAALSYAPNGERAAVGDSASGKAFVFRQLADGGVDRTLEVTGDVMAEFGKVVLMADVTPDPGAELIVSSPASSTVSVFSGNRLRYELKGTPLPSGGGFLDPLEFGAALAAEPSVRGISALWVGEPGTNRIYRCVGSACVEFSNASRAGRFGAALAFDGAMLVVGAPAYSAQMPNQGAVYEFRYDGGVIDGEAQDCNAGLPCVTSETCRAGTCVGGVYCLTPAASVPLCPATQRCVTGRCVMTAFDAGTNEEADAGVDAGVIEDEPDAGTEVADAGDEAMVSYRAGCTSAPGALWVILAVLGWRRRSSS